MIQLIILATLFILFSGIVAMVDAAILSVSRAETEEMVSKNVPGAHLLAKVTQVSRVPSCRFLILKLRHTQTDQMRFQGSLGVLPHALGDVIVGQSKELRDTSRP